jgi:hypothetical protein
MSSKSYPQSKNNKQSRELEEKNNREFNEVEFVNYD